MSKLSVSIDGQSFEVDLPLLDPSKLEFEVTVDGQPMKVGVSGLGSYEDFEWITVDGHPCEIEIDRDLHWIRSGPTLHSLEVRDMNARVSRPVSGDGRVKAPIPGLITTVYVKEGDSVEVGQPLLVLEAMKMENTIAAPRSGSISCLNHSPGQTVTLGELLAEIV